MERADIIVFVGAPPSLSTELLKLKTRGGGRRVIAVASPKSQRGINAMTVAAAAKKAALSLVEADVEVATFSVWAYEETQTQFDLLWRAFGQCAWIVLLPARLRDKDVQTREQVERTLGGVKPLLHEVSYELWSRRKKSPLPLPFGNFRGAVTRDFLQPWYFGQDHAALKDFLRKKRDRFASNHKFRDSFIDDRSYIFTAAANEALHGRAHFAGQVPCFLNGRFRFGVTGVAGHHYDVRKESGLLDGVFTDCEGKSRDFASERREYINIFPNDHLLPERQ